MGVHGDSKRVYLAIYTYGETVDAAEEPTLQAMQAAFMTENAVHNMCMHMCIYMYLFYLSYNPP